MAPAVSNILPACNSAPFRKSTMTSIYAQRLQDFELLVAAVAHRSPGVSSMSPLGAMARRLPTRGCPKWRGHETRSHGDE